MNRTVLALGVMLPLGCATQSSARCDTASTAVIPRWAEPVAPTDSPTDAVASRTVLRDEPDRWASVRITEPAEVDPVDRLLAQHRGRRRLTQLALRDAPVTDTLRMFAELGGFNVVFSDEVPNRRVSVQLRDVTLASAFRTVLASAHLGAVVEGDNIVQVGLRTATP